MRYLHRGPGARAWETRKRNARERDRQIIDALQAARALINSKTFPRRRRIDETLEKIEQALWRFGIH
jgi:hypothetical protein